jgi:hypothetical protein
MQTSKTDLASLMNRLHALERRAAAPCDVFGDDGLQIVGACGRQSGKQDDCENQATHHAASAAEGRCLLRWLLALRNSRFKGNKWFLRPYRSTTLMAPIVRLTESLAGMAISPTPIPTRLLRLCIPLSAIRNAASGCAAQQMLTLCGFAAGFIWLYNQRVA